MQQSLTIRGHDSALVGGPQRRQRRESLHPAAWAVWLACGMLALFLTSNPLYLTTVALAGLLVYSSVRGGSGRSMDALLLAGLALASLTIPLNLISGSTGPTELATLPAVTLPGWLGHVTLGGEVTGESLVYATTQALNIAGVLILVCAFTLGVDHLRLLRSLPAAFVQLGIVGSVGLLLVPETLARAGTLREARIVRGHRDRSGAGLLAMALPLLANALERSLQRAESLDARGFGRLASQRGALPAIGGVVGLVLAATGMFASYYTDQRALAFAATIVGGVLVVAAVLSSGGARASRLRSSPFAAADFAVMGAAIAGVGAFVVARVLGAGDVSYLPFPRVSVPAFEPALALACVLFAVPAFAVVRRRAPA